MNAVMDALISHPGQSMAIAGGSMLAVCVVAFVVVLASGRSDRRQVPAPPRNVPPAPARRPVQPVDQTRVMARQFPARPDDMTAVQYVINPVEEWGGRRG